MPRKDEYSSFLEAVLDSFFDVEKTREIPEIKRILQAAEGVSSFDADGFLKDICEVISGYSIYEVKGRFFDPPNAPVDEDTLVIRFIIQDSRYEGGMQSDLVQRSKEVIRYLITKRFAEEIGLEHQIWFVEYQNCLLQRWVKSEARE